MGYQKLKKAIYLSIALIAFIASPVFADFLTPVEIQRDDFNGVNGIKGASSVTVSPDEKNVYVAGLVKVL